MEVTELVYIGFAKYVVALDRATGSIRWEWSIPKGRQYPALLVDRDQLFVSAMGYTYCLDASTGQLLWENELEGFGVGVACITVANSHANSSRAAAAIDDKQRKQHHHHTT